ncbi:CAP domain-containing protein [Coleofasciculus sp. FACHB-1120]|uniref:CAP domain-containing protein n=1 Tax=Coleofasciculus sp. FACHB-1120 TaxID=2692783 RepID=UPI00168967FE|nr:CAP domain-containing protein [Coleofasciculus sp. FACHB-1120]MBD2741235.1 CAP domain-containing protein [Coleofasciculus sp. FACHB-1120]
MQKLAAGLVFGMLVLAVGAGGCDFIPNLDLDGEISPYETSPAIPSPKSSSSSSNFLTLEEYTHELINQYRKSQNLPPLTLDPRISKEARAHSQAMANGAVPFSHNGFEQRAKAIDKSISYSGASENVAYNQGFSDPAKQAVEGWLKSPGHLKNIQGQYDLTGVGIAKNAKGEYYLTQIFIKRR